MSEPTRIVTGRGTAWRALASALAKRIDGATIGVRPDPAARVHLYLDVSGWRCRTSELEGAVIPASFASSDPGRGVALRMDACVVAEEATESSLRAAGAREVWRILGIFSASEVERVSEALAAHLRGLGAAPEKRDPASSLRVFFSTGAGEQEHRGGPSVRMAQTAEALRARGHTVEVGALPDRDDYDVVHLFNSWPTRSARKRIDAARATRAAVVLSPIYMDHRETLWARRVLRVGFAGARKRIGSTGSLLRLRHTPMEKRRQTNRELREYLEAIPGLIRDVDHVILLSVAELEALQEVGAAPASRSLVWNAVDPAPFVAADPEAFRRECGFERYALCTGRIEFRKNQALLMKALRGSGLGLVLVGACLDPVYEAVVDAFDGPEVRRVGHLEAGGPGLASAYAGAAVFVLPSWVEGAPIAALEAAAAGTPLVLGDRAGVREYFGALAHYCDPADPRSIRRAALAAIEADTPTLRARRRDLLQRKLTVEVAARETEEAYLRAIEARRAR